MSVRDIESDRSELRCYFDEQISTFVQPDSDRTVERHRKMAAKYGVPYPHFPSGPTFVKYDKTMQDIRDSSAKRLAPIAEYYQALHGDNWDEVLLASGGDEEESTSAHQSDPTVGSSPVESL